ncbi:MAG: hypothetical protein WCW62_17660 [Bacteroidales bacterium]
MTQMSTTETASYNALIDQWGFKTRNMLKSSVARLSMKGKKELMTRLQYKTKKDYGETEAVIFNFPRHGVFFHKGVGRGYIMMAGTVVRGKRKDNKSHSANTPQNAFIHPVQGPLKRHPKEWFNPVFTKSIPMLADIIAKTKADQIFDVKNLKLNT